MILRIGAAARAEERAGVWAGVEYSKSWRKTGKTFNEPIPHPHRSNSSSDRRSDNLPHKITSAKTSQVTLMTEMFNVGDGVCLVAASRVLHPKF